MTDAAMDNVFTDMEKALRLNARSMTLTAEHMRQALRLMAEAKNEPANGFALRIMEAIRKYSEGDKNALAGMCVPWVDELLAQLAALRERVKVLEEVLRPFAAIEVREDGPPAPSDGWMATWCNIDTFPTVADVLAARAALAQTPAGGATSE